MVVISASWPSIGRLTRSWQRQFRLSELSNNTGEETSALVPDSRGVPANNDDLLSLRMRALGIEMAEVARFRSGIILDLRKACVACGSRTQCAAEFNSVDPEDDSEARMWQDYCPNVATLNMLSSLLPAMRVTANSA